MTSMSRKIAVLAVAGPLALVSAALAAQSGRYAGTTSQKLSGHADHISLTVSGGAVTKAQFVATINKGGASCVGGVSFTLNKGKVHIDKHGKFSGKLTDGQSASATFHGRVTGKKFTGSFTASLISGGIQGTHTCTSGKVTFTAKHG